MEPKEPVKNNSNRIFFFFNSCNFESIFSRTPAPCASIFHTPKYCFLQRIEDDLKNNPKLLSTDPLETIQNDTATCIRKQDDVQWVSQLELGILVTHSCHKDCHLHRAMYRLQKLWNFSTLFLKTFLKHWEIHIWGSITVAHEMKRTEKYITRLCFSETYPVTFPLY